MIRQAIGVGALAVVVAAASLPALTAPEESPANAPQERPSAARALHHLEWIAQRPWPMALLAVALGRMSALVVGRVLFLLLSGPLWPCSVWLRAREGAWGAAVGMLLVGSAVLLATHLASGWGPENRRPSTLFYLLDHEKSEAYWGSLDPAPADGIRALTVGGERFEMDSRPTDTMPPPGGWDGAFVRSVATLELSAVRSS